MPFSTQLTNAILNLLAPPNKQARAPIQTPQERPYQGSWDIPPPPLPQPVGIPVDNLPLPLLPLYLFEPTGGPLDPTTQRQRAAAERALDLWAAEQEAQESAYGRNRNPASSWCFTLLIFFMWVSLGLRGRRVQAEGWQWCWCFALLLRCAAAHRLPFDCNT